MLRLFSGQRLEKPNVEKPGVKCAVHAWENHRNDTVHEHLEAFLFESSGSLMPMLKNKISVPPNFDDCETCPKVFVEKFFNIIIKAFIKE